MKTPRLHKDRIVGIACLVISLFFGVASTTIRTTLNPGDPGPKLFPIIGCVILFICGLCLLVKKIDTGEEKVFLTKHQWKRALILFGLYIATFLLLWLFGFIAALVVMLFVLCILFSYNGDAKESWKKQLIRAAIYSVVLSALLYLAYDVALDMSLPKGIVWALF